MRLSALLLLAGCAPEILSATPRSVTMNHVTQGTIGDATKKAQAHCDQYDRDAELVPDSNPDGVATFKCVDRESAPSKSDAGSGSGDDE